MSTGAKAPIVLGFDGSEHSEAALAKTIELAHAGGAPVVVVFAYYISPLGGGDVRDYKQALEQVAGEQTDKALAALEAAGIPATVQHVSGKPGEAIVAVAGEVGAGMIVVGSQSRGPLTAAFLGSVVLDLVQRSPVPVLIVPV